MEELDTPVPVEVTSFDPGDRIGRVRLPSGEELRFGMTACVDFIPVVGSTAFLTAVGPHPMGGRRALKLRSTAITEATAAARIAERIAADKAAKQRADDERREQVRPETTPEAIERRIQQAIASGDDGDADMQMLYALTADLELVGARLDHVTAIVRTIAASPDMHYGSPGPLVHFIETWPDYEAVLFPVAREHPRELFVWMLARIVNAEATHAPAALAILRAYANGDSELREQAASYLADRE